MTATATAVDRTATRTAPLPPPPNRGGFLMLLAGTGAAAGVLAALFWAAYAMGRWG